MTHIEIRSATHSDLAHVQALLKNAGLPFEDLREDVLEHFVVVEDASGNLVGAGGMEHYGSDGLLRSVIVHEKFRGTGLGKQLALVVEQHARDRGITDLYLLTTTAENFFPRLGYERFERNRVPERLSQSTEFASLCPASAICMRKQLV